MSDILAGLSELSWNGLKVACDVGAFDVEHRQAVRAYAYVDGEGHDNTGRSAIPIPATLFFLDTVQADAMEQWNRWLPELLDGAAGDLVHPLLGPIRARVLRWRANVSAQVRSGWAVDVTWVETIDDPTKSTIFALVDATFEATAEAAQEAADVYQISYPRGVSVATVTSTGEIPEQFTDASEPTLLSELSALQNKLAVFQGDVFSGSIQAAGLAAQVAGKVATMVDQAEALTDPGAWVAVELLQRVWLQLHDIAQSAARLSPRPIAKRTIKRDTALDAFAASVKNTIDDMAQLNPWALRFVKVPAGNTLTYFKDAA